MALHHEYWLLRHGRSLANEAEIIVSKPENGRDEQWTLAPAGEDQARAAGRKLAQVLLQEPPGPDRPVVVLSSPFSRTLRTATLAAAAAGLVQPAGAALVQVAEELRERYFGDELELQPYGAAYGRIWEMDEQSSASCPGGNGESVDAVAARVRLLFERLESQLQPGSLVLLVSHGDTLSILQAAMTGADTRQHRRFAFETAELRRLRPAEGVAG